MDIIRFRKKEYVVLSRKAYEELTTKAALKSIAAKKLSLSQGKKLACKLIDKWAKEQ